MKTTDKKQVAETMTERSMWIRIGWLWFRMRPLTLGQIFEMGEFTNDIDVSGLSMNLKTNVIAEMFIRHASAPLMQEIFVVCLFRRPWKRWLFRRYILKRLTMGRFQQMINFIITSFTANFFLTSIIFLRQTTRMTEPNPTTPLGQQSEE